MKNAKKFIALILCAALCACNSAPAETEAQDIADTPVTTAASSATTAAVTTPPQEEKKKLPESVNGLTMKELRSAEIILPENASYYDVPYDLRSNYIMVEGSEVSISGWNVCRESSYMLGGGAGDAAFNVKLSDRIDSPYNITYSAPKMVFGAPEGSPDNIKIPLKELKLGCSVTGEGGEPIKARAFIKKTDSDKGTFAELVIDPAYLRGIPVYSRVREHMQFDINGEKVYMDSFSADAPIDSETASAFPDSGYVYAELEVNYLDISYSTASGYNCSASGLKVLDILTDDTKAAIEGSFLEMNGEGKDPEMVKTYNALINSIDDIYTDDTYGIVLLDMDFDKTPEVLVSHYKAYGNDTVWPTSEQALADVDVYRVNGDSLKYIDTMRIAHKVMYSISNCLGLKTLDNGSKAWFATTIEENEGEFEAVDCLFTLSGDTLKKTEVFRAGLLVDESAENYEEGFFYYFGKKIYPEIEHYELTEEEKKEPYAFDKSFNWNGIKSYFGVWELYGFARQEYCKDIEKTYMLYSDWIVPMVLPNENEGGGYSNLSMIKNELSRRDVIFNLAYVVDSYYLGEYDGAKQSYRYEFLGAYAKPVIYLYPEEETEVSVSVDFVNGGEITCSYPEYNGGWNVTAMPDGTIYDASGNEYYCLYWEGEGSAPLDRSRGWCVSGKDTAAFLREKLMYIGLTAREANEFIIYWLPLMQKNAYNIITFHTDDYAAAVPLGVSPAPDSLIRVFMTFEASGEAADIPPQELPQYKRSGFTLVEWGGADITG